MYKHIYLAFGDPCAHIFKKKTLFIANSPITLVSVPNHLPKTQRSYCKRVHRTYAISAEITVTVAIVTHIALAALGSYDASLWQLED